MLENLLPTYPRHNRETISEEYPTGHACDVFVQYVGVGRALAYYYLIEKTGWERKMSIRYVLISTFVIDVEITIYSYPKGFFLSHHTSSVEKRLAETPRHCLLPGDEKRCESWNLG